VEGQGQGQGRWIQTVGLQRWGVRLRQGVGGVAPNVTVAAVAVEGAVGVPV